jgi:putative phosphoesterase
VIADTHDEIVSWDDIHPRVVEAFGPVDLVVHCGDLTTTAVLDRLAEIGPVVAVRSPADPAPEAPRLVDGPRVIDRGGVAIGVVNALSADADLEALFGRRVDVVLHGGTHKARVDRDGAALLVNPGSPSLADNTSVAIVEVADGVPRASIVEL